jgi:hypothetical protein
MNIERIKSNSPMYRYLLPLLLAIAGTLRAQPILKCGAELGFRQALANMSRRADYVARFDVIRETPVNISITAADGSEPYGVFIDQTMENLSRLGFPRDTFGVRIIFQYRVDSSITSRYVQFLGVDTIRIVIPGIQPLARRCYPETRSVDLPSKILTLEGNVFTYDSVSRDADILVERLFDKNGASTRIVKNNYPELESEIREAAALYDEARFNGALGDQGSSVYGTLRRMIRFHVVRLHHDSRRYEVR